MQSRAQLACAVSEQVHARADLSMHGLCSAMHKTVWFSRNGLDLPSDNSRDRASARTPRKHLARSDLGLALRRMLQSWVPERPSTHRLAGRRPGTCPSTWLERSK